MMKKILFSFFSLFFCGLSFSQINTNKLNRFKKSTNVKVETNSINNTVEFMIFPSGEPYKIDGNDVKSKTLNFLTANESILGVKKEDLFISEIRTDNYGLNHVVLKQKINNIPVFDGQLRMHFNSNLDINSINGSLINVSEIKTEPNILADEAELKAVEIIKNQNINLSNKPLKVISNELFVFQKGLIENRFEGNYLVYKIEIRNDLDVREFLFIDAQTGKLVQQFTGMAHALDRVIYEDNTANVVWEEGDAFPGSLSIWQQNEVVASEHAYHFFNNTFGYTSYDNADAQMRTINNDPGISCPNANWNGVTANYCNGTATDDVICHEWGHAYTEYTSGLIYYYQSGALNESFSDVWGETIDLLNAYEDAGENLAVRTNGACNSSLRWQVGEDATAFGGAIRDMWFPTCDGDPGKVTDGNYWCTTGDSGGVHINSGVPNHAYALLVDGGTYNGQTITGLGFVKAAHIFWRAQSQYLTPTSDFSVFADALEASANDLLGVNLEDITTSSITTATPAGLSGLSITASDILELNEVLLAVELRTDPSACGFTPLLSDTTTLCSNATNGQDLFLEDWESGTDGWVISNIPSNPGTWENRDWVLETNLPKGRVGNGIFGADPINGNCTTSLQNGILRLESPVITAPSVVVSDYQMAFNHNVSTEFEWDGANIKYKLNSGVWTFLPGSAFTVNAYNAAFKSLADGNDNPLASERGFTGTDEGGLTGSWGTSVINLATLGFEENDTIQFRFEVGTDGCNGTVGWYLDEIYVYSCTTTLSVDSFSFANSNLSVYPNPSNGTFILSNTKSVQLKNAQVFDINGRLVKTITLDSSLESSIDLREVSQGLYFLKVNTNTTSVNFKLIKD
jgi:Zn-dependent metalloprotease